MLMLIYYLRWQWAHFAPPVAIQSMSNGERSVYDLLLHDLYYSIITLTVDLSAW